MLGFSIVKPSFSFTDVETVTMCALAALTFFLI